MPTRSQPAPILSLAVHPFDKLHGTDTSGLLPGTTIAEGTGVLPKDLTAYYGVAPSILEALVDLWLHECTPLQPIEKTVFLDVGAGKGRAMLLASRHPFLRVEGIELNPQLAAIASSNIALWEKDAAAEALAPVVLHQADATRHLLPLEPTLAYLFHPFEARLLRRFLRHVQASLQAHPRPFDLAYVNPSTTSFWIGSRTSSGSGWVVSRCLRTITSPIWRL